jgi:hypothetical protein
MSKKNATIETLEGLHRWFEGLCKYTDGEAWKDRMYAEGQIFACREAISNYDYMYKDISRGFEKKNDEYFQRGYKDFHRDYNCAHVKYGI